MVVSRNRIQNKTKIIKKQYGGSSQILNFDSILSKIIDKIININEAQYINFINQKLNINNFNLNDIIQELKINFSITNNDLINFKNTINPSNAEKFIIKLQAIQTPQTPQTPQTQEKQKTQSVEIKCMRANLAIILYMLFMNFLDEDKKNKIKLILLDKTNLASNSIKSLAIYKIVINNDKHDDITKQNINSVKKILNILISKIMEQLTQKSSNLSKTLLTERTLHEKKTRETRLELSKKAEAERLAKEKLIKNLESERLAKQQILIKAQR